MAIPKKVHQAVKDLLVLEKKIYSGEVDESLHDEADRLDVEFSAFSPAQIKEGFELYSCRKPFSRQQPKIIHNEPIRKTVKEKFLSGEHLSF